MRFRNQHGLTLLELMIAIGVSVIVLGGISKAFLHFVKSNQRHRATAELQQAMLAAAQMLEQDARMCGFGLPGNGLEVQQASAQSDSVIFFINKKELQTTLAANAPPLSCSLRVTSAAGVTARQWLCLDKTGARVYREISSIAAGNKILLFGNTGDSAFPAAGTQVYFADRVMYFVNTSASPPKLTRMVNATPHILSSMVTNLAVAAKDAGGAVLSANYGLARSIAVTITGGGAGPRDAQPRTETVEMVIRNYQ